MEWYVMLFDYSRGKVVPYNIFNNGSFCRDVEMVLTTPNHTRESLSEILSHAAAYEFRSRCQYEFIVSDWPPSGRKEKFDVYAQLKFNWDRFIDYIWSKYKV